MLGVYTYRLYLGAAGWEHPGWDGAFYPADLPEDWRLAYYNGRCECVWLAYPFWSAQAEATLRQWLDDTRETFRFLLQANPAGASAADRRRLELLAPRLGWVTDTDDARLLWFDAATDLKDFARRLRQPADAPRYLLSRDANVGRLEEMRTLIELLGEA